MRVRVNRKPTQAIKGGRLNIRPRAIVAAIAGWRWLKLERVMGIEPTSDLPVFQRSSGS